MEAPEVLFSLHDYQVEDSVGYLLKRARTMLVGMVDDIMTAQGHGITSAQGNLLFMLSTGKYQSAADLVRETGIDAASMKRTLDRMVARELIRREPSAHDRRLIDLHLTPSGQELARRMPAVYVEALNKCFTGFSAEEVGFLKSLLRKLVANADIHPR